MSDAEPILKPVRLSRGTGVTTDLDLSRRFCEEFLGLECVRHKEDGMLVRDKGHREGGHLSGGPYVVMEFILKDEVDNPQGVFNHWGVDVTDREEVDYAHKIALEHKEYYGIDEIDEIRNQHGSYSFYFSDVMGNWWEIQCSNMTAEEREEWRHKYSNK